MAPSSQLLLEGHSQPVEVGWGCVEVATALCCMLSPSSEPMKDSSCQMVLQPCLVSLGALHTAEGLIPSRG